MAEQLLLQLANVCRRVALCMHRLVAKSDVFPAQRWHYNQSKHHEGQIGFFFVVVVVIGLQV